jgi:hypothetical protein
LIFASACIYNDFMILLGILILAVLAVIGWELMSIHSMLHKFVRQWKLVNRKELVEGEQWESLAIKNDLMSMSSSKVKSLDERIEEAAEI